MENSVNFDVVGAICSISKKLKNSQLKEKKLVGIKTKLNQLNRYLQTTDNETFLFVIIFALKFSNTRIINFDKIADFLGLETLEILKFKKNLQELIKKNYLSYTDENRRKIKFRERETVTSRDSFNICLYVEQAILDNKPIPPDVSSFIEMTNEDFITLVSDILYTNVKAIGKLHYINTMSEIDALEKQYFNLSVVKKINTFIHSRNERMIFYFVCNAINNSREEVSLKDCLDCIYPSQTTRIRVANQCREKTHPLFVNELIKFSDNNDTFDLSVTLDEKGEDIFLDEYTKLFQRKQNKDMITPEKITEKTLFFEPELEKQVNFLTTTLEESSFKNLRTRLEKENLPQGVCALFYGSPGTGKTETVYQLAKSTGRSIVHVDISQSKSMWFGESEKKIKKIFQDYKGLCKECDIKPILLFNEADAIFSKRKESHTSSVAQTENAMQNIILEEMEKLDGILIATTNLTGNLDAAFERRFLFKIEFEKPAVDAKINIWKSKMPKLSKKDATVLANAYDFSGGEIDNIVRKCIMDEVISGKKAVLEDIEILCKQEHIHKQSERKRIGFGV